MAISPEEMLPRIDRRAEYGPFDIVGDVHGCYDELLELFDALGYRPNAATGMRHPQGRRLVFVGDLVDRGPRIVEVVTLARRMVAAGLAFCVPGNHDGKLLRYLRGHHVQISHGLADSIAQIEALPEPERGEWTAAYDRFIGGLATHIILDGGALVVAHAGIRAEDQGRDSPRIRAFTLYGMTTGEIDTEGFPVRLNWAADYTGSAAVIYGHTPVAEPEWQHNTINIDTGCVFGGRLTALRWPERALVSVPAHRVYAIRGR
jgi:protein phosphatase